MSEDMQEQNGPHFRGPFLERFHLGILIPSHTTWETGFAISLLDAVQAMNNVRIAHEQSYFIRNMQTSLLPYSREELVYRALLNSQDLTHILFLDQDNTFPPDVVHWMAYQREPILIANYVRRTVPATPISKGLDGNWVATKPTDTGKVEVKGGGLGVALFERQVFERVPRPWFGLRWRENGATPGHPVIDGEDTWLFEKCRAEGFKVMLDHDMSQHVGHIGKFEYTNNLANAEDYGEADGKSAA